MNNEQSQPTHTPGPWRIEGGEIHADGETFGTIYRTEAWTSGEPVESEDQANACLVSAAPDLLAALKSMVRVFGFDDNKHVLKVARAVIIKAEGINGD